MARRGSSTPARAASSTAWSSRAACRRPESASRWTVGAGSLDNAFIERLWRSLKCEAVYLREIADGFVARCVIGEWIGFYNAERPYVALGRLTPAEAYRGETPVDMTDTRAPHVAHILTGATAATGRSDSRGFWRPELQPEFTLAEPLG